MCSFFSKSFLYEFPMTNHHGQITRKITIFLLVKVAYMSYRHDEGRPRRITTCLTACLTTPRLRGEVWPAALRCRDHLRRFNEESNKKCWIMVDFYNMFMWLIYLYMFFVRDRFCLDPDDDFSQRRHGILRI